MIGHKNAQTTDKIKNDYYFTYRYIFGLFFIPKLYADLNVLFTYFTMWIIMKVSILFTYFILWIIMKVTILFIFILHCGFVYIKIYM